MSTYTSTATKTAEPSEKKKKENGRREKLFFHPTAKTNSLTTWTGGGEGDTRRMCVGGKGENLHDSSITANDLIRIGELVILSLKLSPRFSRARHLSANEFYVLVTECQARLTGARRLESSIALMGESSWWWEREPEAG